MSYGIQLVELAGNISGPIVHEDPMGDVWLASYNPEAFEGRGAADWTINRDEALQFATIADATACYMQVPANRPIRPDGQPNRPLTAFTICVTEL